MHATDFYEKFKKFLEETYCHVTSISSISSKNNLVTADASGTLTFFNLENLKYFFSLPAHNASITSLTTTGDHLLSGSVGCIRRWCIEPGVCNSVCQYNLESTGDNTNNFVNDMAIVDNNLLTASSQGLTSFDLETQKLIPLTNLSALFCVKKQLEHCFVTSGLDGIVRLWGEFGS